MAPIIGLTMYPADKREHVRLPVKYIEAVRRAGGIPLPLPIGETRLGEVLDLLDGCVMTGGGDIDPARYTDQQSEFVYDVDAGRDSFEFGLVAALLERGMPLLCICRGMQVLNVALGGTLHVHVPDVVGVETLHREMSAIGEVHSILHDVTVAGDSRLAEVMGSSGVRSASWHHQAVDKPGEGLRVVGCAPDGVVEAIEVEGHPQVTAVQWHPEITAGEDATQQRLFDGLVRQAGG